MSDDPRTPPSSKALVCRVPLRLRTSRLRPSIIVFLLISRLCTALRLDEQSFQCSGRTLPFCSATSTFLGTRREADHLEKPGRRSRSSISPRFIPRHASVIGPGFGVERGAGVDHSELLCPQSCSNVPRMTPMTSKLDFESADPRLMTCIILVRQQSIRETAA